MFQENSNYICAYCIKTFMETCFFTIVTAVIEFEEAVYTVMEDVGSVKVCATVRGEIASTELQVTLFTEDGTAHSKFRCKIYNSTTFLSYKINTTTDKTDYTHTEIDRVISGRLCIDIPIINNYYPGSDVQFSLRAASTSHNISTIPSTVSILDDGTYKWLKIMNASSLCDVFL